MGLIHHPGAEGPSRPLRCCRSPWSRSPTTTELRPQPLLSSCSVLGTGGAGHYPAPISISGVISLKLLPRPPVPLQVAAALLSCGHPVHWRREWQRPLRRPYRSWEKKRSERQGGRERYTQLNAKFQRIVRRDKKAFLSVQCKEIEENNRIGMTRDLFQKTGDGKGTFHCKSRHNKEQKW